MDSVFKVHKERGKKSKPTIRKTKSIERKINKIENYSSREKAEKLDKKLIKQRNDH